MEQKKIKWHDKLNKIIVSIDEFPLWWLGFLVFAITFLPFLILKEGSVFAIHDQLDETILSYILNAKYLGQDVEVFPELLGGINKTGMQPSAILFVPLYKVFSPFIAFLVQYAIVFLCGYMGMYLAVKQVMGSSILATAAAACFCSLPVQPVYGLSVLGVPLLFYAFLCLYERKRVILGYALIVLFGMTTHLILIGYVALGFWALYLGYMIITKKKNPHVFGGFLLLLMVYIITNLGLVTEFILGKSSYVSHREELINGSAPFWDTVTTVFVESAMHAASLHQYLIVPICIMLLLEGVVLWRRVAEEKKLCKDAASRMELPASSSVQSAVKMYVAAIAIMGILIATAVLYGACKSEVVTAWKNTMHGFLRYFHIERFYWIYPAGWYFEFALVFGIWWGKLKGKGAEQNIVKSHLSKIISVINMPICKVVTLVLVLIPTLLLIKENCFFYMSINQINNGSDITGYISWESYYAEDLMQQLEDEIGRDMSSYRVAHLGINPMPSLMHGFYTVDGYSNNYSLEYKHKFREVIAKELEKNEETRVYFDAWGSRCYLFNGITGTYYMLAKGSNVKYENLEFDMNALQELGCEYIFSGGEIVDAQDMGLEFKGYFETEKSYWGIWLYQLKNS